MGATYFREVQNLLYQKALHFQKYHTVILDKKEKFYYFFKAKNQKSQKSTEVLPSLTEMARQK